jgi:dTDP-4-amino-4,6-dideoxygalactose transaminase
MNDADAREALKYMHLLGGGAVAELEEKLKQHYGMRYALCVSNATTGLLATALSLGLKGSEFITSPFTFGASTSGFLLLGNRPVFADIDKDTLTVSSESIRRLVSKRTKALLAVDIFGNPCDTSALRKLADNYGLFYIADASQSLGGYRDDRPASYLADAIVVSFTTGKSVFAGEGGAVLTNHADLYEKLLWYTQHPSRQRKELGLHLDNELGLNGRIHPLGAVWANAAFEKSLELLKMHQKECFKVIALLNSFGLTAPIHFKRERIIPTFFRLTAIWKNKPNPALLLWKLEEKGYRMCLDPLPVPLIYQQPSFLVQYGSRLNKNPSCPIAEKQVQKRFSLAKRN